MSLELITPPALEPVTLDAAKAFLKVDTGDDDALIASLITAARARTEWHCGRALITQSWIQWLDCWPMARLVEIALPPLQSVGAITIYARDGTETVLDAGNYVVDRASQPGRVALDCGVVFSDLRNLNGIAIAFTAGYGDAASDVPAPIVAAVLQIVADLYQHRGDAPAELGNAAQALLAPYRIWNF